MNLRVITLPNPHNLLGQPKVTHYQDASIVDHVAKQGNTPEQPNNGFSLPSMADVVILKVLPKKWLWGISSVITPNTIYTFSGSTGSSVQDVKDMAQLYVQSIANMYDSDEKRAITLETDFAPINKVGEVAAKHELTGLLYDLTMSVVTGGPMHYTYNFMTMNSKNNTVHSKFVYHVPSKEYDIIDMRTKVIKCLLTA